MTGKLLTKQAPKVNRIAHSITLWLHNGTLGVGHCGNKAFLLIGPVAASPAVPSRPSLSEYEGKDVVQHPLCVSQVHAMGCLFVNLDLNLLRQFWDEICGGLSWITYENAVNVQAKVIAKDCSSL